MITINFDKAKEITKSRLRFERASMFVNLDIQFQRALEANEDTSVIILEKNKLRDITKLPNLVNTLEELKSITCES